MDSKYRGNSLFDDIFQLQSTIPENDIDPEDPEDGFRSGLTEGATDVVEELGSTQLKKRTALILDDPKYQGKRTSRKDLYSDDEDEDEEFSNNDGVAPFAYEFESEEDDEDDDSDADEGDDEDDLDDNEESEEENEMPAATKKDTVVRAPKESSDSGKGKAVSHQLHLWDDLMRCRISLQKMMSACNRLPMPDDWEKFVSFPQFQKEAQTARGSMRKVLKSLMDLHQQLNDKLPEEAAKGKLQGSDDEEITSESDPEDETESSKDTKVKDRDEDADSKDYDDDDDDEESEGMEDNNGDEKRVRQEDDMDYDDGGGGNEGAEDKQKEVEDILTKGHKKFSTFRNNTLLKWDEKTRLSSANIKSKNFSAFDISVLKQIQQVLGNKVRLIRRIHQNRSNIRILGQTSSSDNMIQELVLEDDEDEIEVRGRPRRQEPDVNFEIVDDSDFYQMCLKDFIQMKQNDDDTNPELLNKHMVEIQNLRKKQKRKVDTRATKGKKIRYHVKEKLRNFMAPYDKSTWSDQQKDDLFKALFGGQQGTGTSGNVSKKRENAYTIDIGLI